MKPFHVVILILIAVISGLIVALLKINSSSLESERSLKADIKLRQDSIRMYRIKEAAQSKRIDFFMLAYNNAKDSLEIERGRMKVKYLKYEQPIKIDLSSDKKRDSVINQLVK